MLALSAEAPALGLALALVASAGPQQRTLIGSITVIVIARIFAVDIIFADRSVTSHNPVVTMAETCPAVFAQSILIVDHSPHVQEHGIFF